MPPMTARAAVSMWGVPRPWKAGMTQAPPLSATLAASVPVSSGVSMTPRPSRSQVIAAPAVIAVPSRQ
jgi:hypothetical protein